MATFTSYLQGTPSWIEHSCSDQDVAKQFYGGLFGWTFRDDEDGQGYRYAQTPAADSIQGGVFDTGGKVPSYAVFYIRVDDVDEVARKAGTAGGKVLVPPTAVPNGLRFALLTDPSGGQFGVYTPGPATVAS